VEHLAAGDNSQLSTVDIARILLGKPAPPLSERPLDKNMNRASIQGAWAKTGIVPCIRRSLLENPRLQFEDAGAATAADPRAAALVAMEKRHAKLMVVLGTAGFNIAALQPVPAPKKKAAREPEVFKVPQTRAQEIAAGLAASGRLSAGTVLHHAGAMALTSEPVMASLVQHERVKAQEQRDAASKARGGAEQTEAVAGAVMAQVKADGKLSSAELLSLIKGLFSNKQHR